MGEYEFEPNPQLTVWEKGAIVAVSSVIAAAIFGLFTWAAWMIASAQ